MCNKNPLNLQRMGKIYRGKPLKVKTRAELITSLKPQYLRADNGDMPATQSAKAFAVAAGAI